MTKVTKSLKKKTKTKKKANTPIKEEISLPKEEVENKVDDTSIKPKSKRAYNCENVLSLFDELIDMVEIEIQNLRDSPTKTKGIKFLRTLNKRVKILKNRTNKTLKHRKKKGHTNNKNSGFLKPVNISDDMAKFTGWDKKTLRSRVEVTKYICNYIKEHDLQNPDDRRQIRPDNKLQKLLGYNPRKEKEPLRYYSLQTHLKKHFPH